MNYFQNPKGKTRLALQAIANFTGDNILNDSKRQKKAIYVNLNINETNKIIHEFEKLGN